MREVGYSFTTRCLYRNGHRPGWIVRYGWKQELTDKGSRTDIGRNTTCRECASKEISTAEKAEAAEKKKETKCHCSSSSSASSVSSAVNDLPNNTECTGQNCTSPHVSKGETLNRADTRSVASSDR